MEETKEGARCSAELTMGEAARAMNGNHSAAQESFTTKHQVHHHFIHSSEHVKESESKVTEVPSITIQSQQQQQQQPSHPAIMTNAEHTVACNAPQQSHQGTIQQTPVIDTNTDEKSSTIGASGGSDNGNHVSEEDTSTAGTEEGEDASTASTTARGKKKVKKDRSKLRKGKWTVEEEEYTTRIIHYFSTGLLTLPEGTTLRSYLAEKLNCDPMRITKKFAGASCLGKRVYHLCDRTQATVNDVEMAKGELTRLEHRFRLRAEHGQSGVPMHAHRPDPLAAITNGAMPVFAPQPPGVHPAPAAVAASWLQSIAASMGGQPVAAPIPGQMQGQHAAPPVALTPSPQAPPGHTIVPAPWHFQQPRPQWVAAPAPLQAHPAPSPGPNQVAVPIASVSAPGPVAAAPAPMPPSNEAITLAWAQAAASLTPALSQLAAANLQQHQQQLQSAYESQLQSYNQHQAPSPAPLQPAPPIIAPQPQVSSMPPSGAPAGSIQGAPVPGAPRFFVAPPGTQFAPARPTAMQAPPPVIKPSPVARPPVPIAPSPPVNSPPPVVPLHNATLPAARPPQAVIQSAPTVVAPKLVSTEQTTESPPSPQRSKEDEVAGSMLMGFLSSLRKGYMEAKQLKDNEVVPSDSNIKEPSSNNETSSGSTSQPADSSLEDSQSDKGKDPSSSEESEKGDLEKEARTETTRPRGPPRKRHKSSGQGIGEFTSKNVEAHNSRMNALHHQKDKHGEHTATPSSKQQPPQYPI